MPCLLFRLLFKFNTFTQIQNSKIMKNFKTITVNWNNLESVKKAEKLKSKYENLGYKLISQTSYSLTYQTF